MDRHEVQISLVQDMVIREVAQGIPPRRQNITGGTSFDLPTEKAA